MRNNQYLHHNSIHNCGRCIRPVLDLSTGRHYEKELEFHYPENSIPEIAPITMTLICAVGIFSTYLKNT